MLEDLRKVLERKVKHARKRVGEGIQTHGPNPEDTHNYHGGRNLGLWEGRLYAYETILDELDELATLAIKSQGLEQKNAKLSTKVELTEDGCIKVYLLPEDAPIDRCQSCGSNVFSNVCKEDVYYLVCNSCEKPALTHEGKAFLNWDYSDVKLS